MPWPVTGILGISWILSFFKSCTAHTPNRYHHSTDLDLPRHANFGHTIESFHHENTPSYASHRLVKTSFPGPTAAPRTLLNHETLIRHHNGTKDCKDCEKTITQPHGIAWHLGPRKVRIDSDPCTPAPSTLPFLFPVHRYSSSCFPTGIYCVEKMLSPSLSADGTPTP
ncbi:uncharacterized protein BDZ83DRAFT_626432 [Colletotrichum acutatum]|uniref:C2H2-type domain-containing protein n=1 Tax=Glomerella acutata TaxID=27357 RepID=A0AAD8XEH7_GLOAC|nr:uncharacterized protein BDZ83DRAFT_626432 [Colletotrichum acutatum]KAK1723346.1 hypothetical protein BDZ83DRAFT_626432 [Colletotrichum acutatum]